MQALNEKKFKENYPALSPFNKSSLKHEFLHVYTPAKRGLLQLAARTSVCLLTVVGSMQR